MSLLVNCHIGTLTILLYEVSPVLILYSGVTLAVAQALQVPFVSIPLPMYGVAEIIPARLFPDSI